MQDHGGGWDPPPWFDKIAGAILNATRKRRGPGGTEGRMPGVIHPSTSRSSAQGGSSSMVEHQFSKLITRVRFPPSAPLRCLCQARRSARMLHESTLL